MDVGGTQVLLDSGVPLVLVPCLGVVSHLLSSVPEIERHVEPYGDIGRFLAQRSKEYSEDHVGFSKVIWDMAPVAWLLDPSWCESVIAPTPIVTDQVTWSVDRARHPMRYVFRIHRDPAADIGSFRQAADVLRLRQSQLSRCVRQHEHSIGVVVFERSSGGVKPTPGGREFLRTARIILEQVDALVASAKTTRRGETGRLAVGFCTSLSTGNLRATLLDFKVHFPHIELGTVERSRTRLTTALRNGTLDILVVTGATPLLESQTLPLERILVALPEDHPLTTRDVVLWTDLQNQTVLLSQYDPGHELEDVLISKLPLPGDRPQIERHDVSRGIIKSLISMRLGISLVMESDIGTSFAGLVYRELRDGIRPSYISFSAFWRGAVPAPRCPRPSGRDDVGLAAISVALQFIPRASALLTSNEC